MHLLPPHPTYPSRSVLAAARLARRPPLRSRLGVDVCEAGFPIASDGDFEAVSTIAKEVGPITEGRIAPMRICGLARANLKGALA